MSLADAIKREAYALGFDAVGIAAVIPDSRGPAHLLDRLQEWLQRGYQGTMAWMARDPFRRAHPAQVLSGCRSILSLAMNYNTGHRAIEGPGYGRVARYAWGQDYHRVIGERLKQLEDRIKALAPDATTRAYVDTGPIMEKAWAQEAGLGWIGKHSNLVSSEHGSWLVLGEILTTLELSADEPATDLCGNCSLCIRACPTGAIVEPYVVDARRCISYLTIEFRGTDDMIPDDMRQQMANRIFGCDDCLDVCPFNLQADTSNEPAFFPSATAVAPWLEDLAGLSDRAFIDRFQESPIRRAKREGLLRNVAVAQRNEAEKSKRGRPPLPSLPK